MPATAAPSTATRMVRKRRSHGSEARVFSGGGGPAGITGSSPLAAGTGRRGGGRRRQASDHAPARQQSRRAHEGFFYNIRRDTTQQHCWFQAETRSPDRYRKGRTSQPSRRAATSRAALATARRSLGGPREAPRRRADVALELAREMGLAVEADPSRDQRDRLAVQEPLARHVDPTRRDVAVRRDPERLREAPDQVGR